MCQLWCHFSWLFPNQFSLCGVSLFESYGQVLSIQGSMQRKPKKRLGKSCAFRHGFIRFVDTYWRVPHASVFLYFFSSISFLFKDKEKFRSKWLRIIDHFHSEKFNFHSKKFNFHSEKFNFHSKMFYPNSEKFNLYSEMFHPCSENSNFHREILNFCSDKFTVSLWKVFSLT